MSTAPAKKKAPAKRAPAAAAKPKPVPLALLAAALRAQSEGVFIAEPRLGPEGLTVLFVNDSFCAMTGHAAGKLVGRAHAALHVEPADLERLRAWLPHAMPGQPLVGEGYLRRADGGTLYASWSFDPLAYQPGKITHLVATYRDMTERRRLQEALVQAQRLDAVGHLAGGVAHDFNNLLSVINGYCEILAARVTGDSSALSDVNEIHHAGRKAAALTQQLLAFGRRRPLDARVVNLNDLVQANTEILNRLLGRAARLDIVLADDLAPVRIDPAQFQQVLINLVVNARDALRAEGRIAIRTTRREIKPGFNRRLTDTPPGVYAAISVSDNGAGMDAQTQLHLFEPFYTTKPEGKGTGLGLALAYGVVQQCGGFISVKSSLEVGSTFEILLPVTNEPVSGPLARDRVAPLPSTRGTETVLLVEADDVVRKMVAGIFTADGYRVITENTFGKALAAAREAGYPVHLLIANVSGEGAKLMRALPAAPKGLRVLNVCPPALAGPLKGLKAAHQAHLAKPFALSEVLQAARKLLDAGPK